ncbi:hypothetical protein [Mucilaginibacter sp. KACC 22063]|uniref:hypothetical protein n=1 Tax=Mucilaginibacter sp. KACC 22063 TaxID=3025666 RepID=UPI002366EA5A|nr:hypothetical protein [Mucilaginibacter sp. KACC 22063]WDF54639.1 hypothetical protein PQ461_17035 [Mucilaginibacter sp. KACC 22063]
MNTTENANSENHYILLTISIFIGLVGVYLRFAGDAPVWSWAANAIMMIATAIALRTVFKILQ